MVKDSDKQAAPRVKSDRVFVKQRELLSSQWAKLEDVTFDYLRSDGQWQTQRREIYHRGHGAAILLYDLARETIVLTRQFRFPAWELGGDGFLYEVPAGVIESDNPEETVLQETSQETGFFIEDPQFLFKAYATPGSVTEQIYYFAAVYDNRRRTGSGGGVESEGEDIEVIEMKLTDAVNKISAGNIEDAKTIILIQYAQLHIFDRSNLTPSII